MKKFIKYLSLAALSLLGLIVLLALAIETPFAKSWLKNKVIAIARESLNGELTIASLSGNLFNHLELKGIRISQEGEDVVVVDHVTASYNPIALLSNQIVVTDLIIRNPRVVLIQQQDSTWNLARLIKESEEEPEAEPDSVLGWAIKLPSFRLDSGQVDIRAIDSTLANLPTEIRGLQVALGFGYSDEGMQLSLSNLSFHTQKPELSFQVMPTEVEVSEKAPESDKLQIDTKVELKAPALGTNEFKIYGNPRLELEVKGTLADMIAKLDLAIADGHVGLWSRLKLDVEPYRYQLKGNVANLNLKDVTHRDDLDTELNFEMEVQGTGVEWGELDTYFDVTVDTGYAFGRQFEAIILRGKAFGDSATFSGDLTALGSTSSFSGALLSSEQSVGFEMNGDFESLNLSRLVSDSLISTDLNFDFHATGQGRDWQHLSGAAGLIVAPSRVAEAEIESAEFSASFNNELVEIEKFEVNSPIAKLNAEGTLGITQPGLLRFHAEAENLGQLASIAGMDTLQGKASLNGELRGALDSLQIEASLALEEASTPTMAVQRFKGTVAGLLAKTRKSFEIRGRASEVSVDTYRDLEAGFNVLYEDTLITFELDAEQKDEFAAELQGVLALQPQGYAVRLEHLQIDRAGQVWQLVEPPADLQFTGSEIRVSNFVVSSNGQSLSVGGKLDTLGSSDLRLAMTDVSISGIATLMKRQTDYDGRVNLELDFKDTMRNPRIQGVFRLEEGRYRDQSIDALSGDFGYDPSRIRWDVQLSLTHGDSILHFIGVVPFHLSLQPFVSEMLEQEPLEIRAVADSMDLSLLQGFMSGVEDLKGKLNADVRLHNTLEDLQGEGPIELDGSLRMPELGIRYDKIDVLLRLQGKQVAFENFRIESKDGFLRVVEGNLALAQKQIEGFNARLEAQNFQIVDSRTMQAAVSGEIDLSGSVQALRFGGELSVPSARIYYPAFMEEETAVVIGDKPFFVIAEDTARLHPQGALRFQKETDGAETAFTETEYYKNIRGNLTLILDRNIWLRSEEANVEIEGRLEVQKPGADFVFFGTVSTVRGYYELQGNRFEIEEGEIRFKGDPEMNADLHVEAVHEFTGQLNGEMEKHEIRVIITGTKEAPQFEFTLDGKQAEQKDVFSILLFGRPFDQLTAGQKSGVAQESGVEEKAAGFITGQLVERLSSALGSELNLDVLQVESGQDLEDTRVRVGKYVTKGVFVSVSQDFGPEGNQKVELEYELPERIFSIDLFLQASQERRGNTGLDLIWKHDW